MLSAESIEPTKPAESELDILDKPIFQAIDDYIQMAAGNNPKATRDRGLFVVPEDLKKINDFARYANQLPVEYVHVVRYLGYPEAPVEALGAHAIARMHQDLHALVFIWNGIQREMKSVASTLISFHSDLEAYGNRIVERIKKMDGFEVGEALVGDFTGQKVGELPSMPFREKDLSALPSLFALTQELVTRAHDYAERARQVRNLMESFIQDLTRTRSSIGRKMALIASDKSSDIAISLNQELAELNTSIEEVERTYKTFTDYIWVGAYWGPVGLLISGTIYGPTAIDTKSKHNTLIERKAELSNKLKTVNHLAPLLSRLQLDLQKLYLLTNEALNGAGNIENLWVMLGTWIETSVKSIRRTNNATELFLFEANLSTMIKKWSEVKREAVILMWDLNQESSNPDMPPASSDADKNTLEK